MKEVEKDRKNRFKPFIDKNDFEYWYRVIEETEKALERNREWDPDKALRK